MKGMVSMTFWNQSSIQMAMQPTYKGQWMQKMVDYLDWKGMTVMGCEGLHIKTLVLYYLSLVASSKTYA